MSTSVAGTIGTVTGNTAPWGGGVGIVNWVNADTTHLASIDASFATCSLSAAGSNDGTKDLIGSNWGFAVPANAVMVGCQAQYSRKASVATGIRGSYYIATNITGGGGSQATGSDLSDIGTTVTAKTVGSTSSFSAWNAAPTVAEVNASSFGTASNYLNQAAASRVVSADQYTLTVVYDVVSFGPAGDRSRIGRRSKNAMGVLLRCAQVARQGVPVRTVELGRLPIFEMDRADRLRVYRTMPLAFV